MADSLAALAAAVARDLDPRLPKPVRVSAVESWLASERPSSSVASRKAAAVAAVDGKVPVAPVAEKPSRSRGRKAADAAAERTGKAARRVSPVSPVSSATTVKGLMLQSVSLVALYWLVKTPQAVARATGGVAAAFRWLASTRGVPGR